jgi:large subunit ribosomal protein L29
MARKSKDINRMSDEELGEEVRSIRRRIFDLRTQAVTEKIEDTSQFRKTRRQVARLLAEQTARQAKNMKKVAS